MMGLRVAESPPHPALTRRPLPASGERLNTTASALANLSPLAGRGRIALAIRVRGSFSKRHRYDFKHPVDIAENIVVPETKHTVTVIDEPRVANRVTGTLRMLPAVDLDHRPILAADEIHCVRPDRLLPDEFAAGDLPRADPIPELSLGVGGDLPQAPRACGSHLIGFAHVEAPPHPALRADLSPIAGRG